jgi:hypothetical protein
VTHGLGSATVPIVATIEVTSGAEGFYYVIYDRAANTASFRVYKPEDVDITAANVIINWIAFLQN